MGDYGNDDDGDSVDRDENQDEATEEMVCDSQYLQKCGRRATTAIRAIPDLCKKHNVKKPADLVRAQANIEK